MNSAFLMLFFYPSKNAASLDQQLSYLKVRTAFIICSLMVPCCVLLNRLGGQPDDNLACDSSARLLIV